MTSAAPTGPERGRTAREERRIRWIARIGTLIIRALASTWRYRTEGLEHLAALRERKQAFVFAFWHGEMLPLLYERRDEQVAVLVSSHRDGEIIAQICARLGFRLIRGSSSRGAGRALLGLIRELEAGREVAVTPDGPRGPRHQFAPGALIAAQRAGAPVVPIAVHPSRAWHLRSWDRFIIPKPFARIHVVYGEPMQVEAGTAQAVEQETERFAAAIGMLAERARA